MRAILNRQMFSARTFDSGALGVLASVVHQFPDPGRYEAVIRHGHKAIRSVPFEVSESSSNMQLDIDLALPAQPRAGGEADCECKGTHAASGGSTLPSVSPKGYVLFHVSHGDGGYAVLVGRQGTEVPAFDSTALNTGDLFVVSLLAPTRYTMTNRRGKASGTIVVRMAHDHLRKLASSEAIYVESSHETFSPADVQAASAQGIVFRVRDSARIVIEQVDDPPEKKMPRRRRFVVLRQPQPKTEAAKERNR